jgi:hypothetical protein
MCYAGARQLQGAIDILVAPAARLVARLAFSLTLGASGFAGKIAVFFFGEAKLPLRLRCNPSPLDLR